MLPKNYYPTPKHIIKLMADKIQNGNTELILEPSAGKGDIVEYLRERGNFNYRRSYNDFRAIEIDPGLQSILKDKNIKVVDSDFLNYSGPDKFDLIIANPPFDQGDKHLLKAIDIMYRGEIIFLLNAETIRNPYTNTRKLLMKKLIELDAEIEFIDNAFVLAERKTWVEIALVYIKIERRVEEDLFKDMNDRADDIEIETEDEFYEVSNRQTVQELVAEYNQLISIGMETITGYYKNYKKIGQYIGLNDKPDSYSSGDMTDRMKAEVNNLVAQVRKDFWRKTLDLKEVYSRMTAKRQEEFEHLLNIHSDMDFTESNIRQFVLNLISGYKQTINDAVMEIFNKFTIKHCYGQVPDEQNIHYFDGWKTNKAFRCNHRVIIPVYGYGSSFQGYGGQWELRFDIARELRDIDTVMSYFDGCSYYSRMTDAIERAFAEGRNRKIISTYFEVSCFKKGTVHLRFRDENILRRFNVAACMGKNWLPFYYGQKPYEEMDREEKDVVDSFEGHESYNKNLNQPVFANHVEFPMIEERN